MAMRLRCDLVRVILPLLLAGTVRAQPTALSVNPGSREEVRQFFRAVYNASENVPMGWTGRRTDGVCLLHVSKPASTHGCRWPNRA
jgi:hypothetical protein